jgi:N-acyl-phosphatidylethanolamine-hydrolysing phospholipase D
MSVESRRLMAAVKRYSRVAAGSLALLLPAIGQLASCTHVNPYYEASKPHHRAGGFTNNYGPPGGQPLSALLKWVVQRTRDGLPKPPSQFVQGYNFPVIKPDLEFLRANRSRITATWIGHATMLLQIDGVNILTDPQFSERAFMVQWAGPKRKTPLPATLAELPHIDLVMISHNHYDHLDADTIDALIAQAGGAPLFVAPLGVDRWLAQRGAQRVERFDWWDSKVLLGLAISCVPVHHWSARSPFDRNTTLWGGWVVKTPAFSMFFVGDTGYSPDFKDIGERFGGFDLAMIPVGAYEPRWFMKDQHVDPDEAVRIHQDVKARRSIGIHWGTFELTDEPLDQPIGDLAQALAKADLPADRFVLFKHGETRTYSRSVTGLGAPADLRHGNAMTSAPTATLWLPAATTMPSIGETSE